MFPELESIKRSITENYNAMIKAVDKIDYTMKKQPTCNYFRMQNIKLRKKFVDYLIKGLDFHESLEFLETEFDINQQVIETVLRVQYEYLIRKERIKKIYTAHAMTAAGYTPKQIAVVIKTTPATVRNYLKISISE